MPGGVGRTDSQRSDGSSLRPRVSFNRDVHVKRIVATESPQVVGALSGDGAGHLVPTPVRRERAGRLSKRQLAEEAAKVLEQADRVACTTQPPGVSPDKFYTLPTRRKHRRSASSSPQERRRSEELGVTSGSPPRKPPRTFATPRHKSSLLGLFKRDETDGTNLKRSRSDASHVRHKRSAHQRTGSESEEVASPQRTKKAQLSPIIEVTPRDDYFTNPDSNKENVNTLEPVVAPPPRKRWYHPDSTLKHSESVRVHNENNRAPAKTEVVIIDVSEAKDASYKKSAKKFSSESFKSKLKSLTTKKVVKSNKSKERTEAKQTSRLKETDPKIDAERGQDQVDSKAAEGISPLIQEKIEALEKHEEKPSEMIHSSQQPADKLPLTKGHKVDTMVKRLSRDKCSPPPKTNIMITPTVTVQHNNNKPFSYTQPRASSPEPTSPVIYAQVVCGQAAKQTVHAAYTNGKKQLPHSDSDEGLGCEEQPGLARHYGSDKCYTRFGDHHSPASKYDEEYPITPKFKSTNGYSFNEYSKTERTHLVDSSARGRGDGMDSRRRESLTEQSPQENGFLSGSRRDLSYRRDQLESRINSRRLNHNSPEFDKPRTPTINKYVSETTSRYYRHGSASPLGYTEKYTAETKLERSAERQFTQERSFGERHEILEEPKSLDSLVSDYRSSPEALNGRKYYASQEKSAHGHSRYKSHRSEAMKNRDHYKSNPEIHQRHADTRRYEEQHDRFATETYHDSLRRQRREVRAEDAHHAENGYFEHADERKDKFGDSGIENDFRRDSGENVRGARAGRPFGSRPRDAHDSEDEGFASSLLIASERQHTEDNLLAGRRTRREYDSDREARDIVHRERSIDDGSHFDPRLDKDVQAGELRGTLKRIDKKPPPKPAKKSGLEKVKQLFSRDSSKKKREQEDAGAGGMLVREESLRARYNEYRAGTGTVERSTKRSTKKEHISDNAHSVEYGGRRRLSTPSPSPPRNASTLRRETATNTSTSSSAKANGHSTSWFKSLDRLSRKKTDKVDRTIAEDTPRSTPAPPATKNLRFFGDTDVESTNGSVRRRPAASGSASRARSQSARDLHNITEELQHSDEEQRADRKPPPSPVRRARAEDTGSRTLTRGPRKKHEGSSLESSTEGDSSQQSQRSVVYLHAATVGDIPGPGYLSRNGRRAASREELASNGSSRMQPQVKTLSRSFSMLAPWKPRHKHEGYEVDYTSYGSKTTPVKKSSGGKTAKEISKKMSESRKSNQNLSTLNRRSRSKENMSQTLNRKSKDEPTKTSGSTTLYKKKEKSSKENTRYSNRDDRKMSNKSMSVESLGAPRSNSSHGGRDEKISRSVSMPRDPDKSAGWFGSNKKSKKTVSSHRL